MRVTIAFDEPSRLLESTGDSIQRRVQSARRAAAEVVSERNAVERDQVKLLERRMSALKRDLTAELLGGVTDFRAYDIRQRIAAIDRIVGDHSAQAGHAAMGGYVRMLELGEMAADEPVRAAMMKVLPSLPSIDAGLATVAAENTLELLTQPMQQFASDVKVALRGVALAGEGRMAAIQKLRERIAGQGMDNAQYKAERIIRTELSRVFNQATYSRLLELSKDFTFLRKFWRSSNDNRTRLGHRQAAKSYSRGQGARIADLFIIDVHQESPGKPPKLLGQARLRFPVDPEVDPVGRIGAAATIMCRCNAIIDFDVADFARYSAQQIQMALGGVLPKPGPVPVPPAPAPMPALPKPRRARKPPAPKPVTQTPPLTAATGPRPGEGPKVSAALQLPASKEVQQVAKVALAAIDKAHSDGRLDRIPLKLSSARSFFGQYLTKGGAYRWKAVEVKLSKSGLSAHPLNTLAHEIGHWLDNTALASNIPMYASRLDIPTIKAWRMAAQESTAIKTLTKWAYGSGGTAPGIPKGVNARHVRYLLSTHEVFARSYAQYVAVTSGDPAMLAELRLMQRQATSGPVGPDVKFSTVPMGKTPVDGTWNYPTVWQDDDFEPIRKAFDALFEDLGWRRK